MDRVARFVYWGSLAATAVGAIVGKIVS